MQIVEFGDLECPFCALFHLRLDSLPAHMRREVAITLIQYPLSYHRFAVPAARALECANAQGRFGEFVAAVFKKQDSLGLKSFGAFAAKAGVADTSRLVSCTRRPGEPVSVSRGRALATKLGVRGTPTVLINGWRFSVAPGVARLNEVINDVLAGRPAASGR